MSTRTTIIKNRPKQSQRSDDDRAFKTMACRDDG
jgi:hypothetical protein